MKLTFDSVVLDEVLVLRCQGRISFGPEVEALEQEVRKQTRAEGTDIFLVKHVVLNLAETDYVDSSGLGALVRMQGVLAASGGGLKLCQLSPTVAKVIEITNLGALFPPYESEAQAIAAFSGEPRRAGQRTASSKGRIVCVDPSSNLLAGIHALLSKSGCEVFTTRYVGEAGTLVRATNPDLVICGPGIAEVPTAAAMVEKLRQSGRRVLQLSADFHTSEAGEAGHELVAQVESLIAR